MDDPKEHDQTVDRLQAWFAGDQDALAELVRDNVDWMRRRVRTEMIREDRGALESIDVVQDALARLLRRGPSHAPRSRAEFRALLAQVMRASLFDDRDRRRSLRRGGHAVEALPSSGLSRIVVDGRDATRPDEAAARRERAERVATALEHLPPTDAEVVRLRHVEGATFEEVAAAVGLESADAARMRYRRALPKVARHLEADEPTEG